MHQLFMLTCDHVATAMHTENAEPCVGFGFYMCSVLRILLIDTSKHIGASSNLLADEGHARHALQSLADRRPHR